MKTFTRVAIAGLTISALAGVASAQQKTPAQPAPKAAEKAAPKAAEKAAPMMMAPPEVETMAKAMGGTWKCKGEEWDDKGAKAPMTATSNVKLDLDKMWMVETMEAKGRMPFKMIAYTTYDPSAKKWRRVAVTNHGHMMGTSDGEKDGKMVWHMDVMSPMGTAMMRDHIETPDPKTMKAKGEWSMDKGKTWMPMYEMTCKK